LASPGPIAAATSAGVDPAGIARAEPSGSVIVIVSDMAQAPRAAPGALQADAFQPGARLARLRVSSAAIRPAQAMQTNGITG